VSDPYELRIAGPTARAIADKLPEAVATAVLQFITGPLIENPRRVETELRGPLFGTYAARRGSYQVLYTIDEQHWLVTVKDVEHRSDIYRRH
jgi:mRNA interferase RelE/StbE